MSKLRVLLVHNDGAELGRRSSLLEKAGHSVLPLETMADASEALGLQRFDAVLLPENVPADQLSAFTSSLRQMERDRRGDDRTAIVGCSDTVAEGRLETVSKRESPGIDALIPIEFDPALFADIVGQIQSQVSRTAAAIAPEETEQLAVFDREGFSELLGNSRELLDEITGLFLDESGSQMREMDTCLRIGDFVSLAKVAHTLKGSLGTLHAHRARSRAQALEIAATGRMQEQSQSNLDRLRDDLDELLPLVTRMRSEL